MTGYRWLIMHQASSEARRRYELGQFLVIEHQAGGQLAKAQPPIELGGRSPLAGGKAKTKVEHKVADVPTFETKKDSQTAYFGSKDDIRRWFYGCLVLEKKLAAFGPLYSQDPVIQFCVQSARRQLGEGEQATRWYRAFAASAPPGAWRSCARPSCGWPIVLDHRRNQR